jgi:hypothetical protein
MERHYKQAGYSCMSHLTISYNTRAGPDGRKNQRFIENGAWIIQRV